MIDVWMLDPGTIAIFCEQCGRIETRQICWIPFDLFQFDWTVWEPLDAEGALIIPDDQIQSIFDECSPCPCETF